MKSKTAIVTGASSGIGKAIADLFINKGYNIVMNARNKDNLRKVYEGFGSPNNAVCVEGDVSLVKTGRDLVKKAVEAFGSVDVLINNAGIFSGKPFIDVKPYDLDRFIDVNLKGTFFTSQAAIRQMLKQKGGCVINMGTVLTDHAIPDFRSTAPVASKGAIHALTKQLAAEYGKNNIRVNAIAPGVIRSPLQAKNGIDDPDILAGLHLLKRIGEPEDIAEAALYLSTANFVTGEILNIDGGHTAGHIYGS